MTDAETRIRIGDLKDALHESRRPRWPVSTDTEIMIVQMMLTVLIEDKITELEAIDNE